MPNNTMIQPPPASDPRGGTFCRRCLFDLLAGEAEQREALEPILIRSAEHDTAATWRLKRLNSLSK